MSYYTDEEFKQQYTEEQRSTVAFDTIFQYYKSKMHEKGYINQDGQWHDSHVQIFDDILENFKRGKSADDSIEDVMDEYRDTLKDPKNIRNNNEIEEAQ